MSDPKTIRRQLNRRLLVGWGVLTMLASVARLGVLWVAVRAVWAGETTDLAVSPITCLLYPEALFLPADLPWTAGAAVLFSLALIAGTAAFTGTWVVMFAPLLRALLAPDHEP